MPLKATRTTLSEIIKATGVGAVRAAIKNVPTTAIIHQYTDRLSGTINSGAALVEPASAASFSATAGMGAGNLAGPGAEIEAVFERLHQKEHTQTAIKELYDFTVPLCLCFTFDQNFFFRLIVSGL
jgi:hypothetical protein